MSEPEEQKAEANIAAITEDVAPSSCRRCIWPWLITGVSLAALAASLSPWFIPQLAAHTPLMRYLESQKPNLALVVPHPVMPVAPPPVVDDSRLQALETEIQNLRTAQQQDAAKTAQIHDDSVKAATDAATSAASAAAISATRPLLLATAINTRLSGGLAYRGELDALAPSLTETEHAALGKLAGGGAPADLAQQITKQQRHLVAAWRDSVANGWWEKLKARLSGLILIRTPGAPGDAVLNDLDKLVQQITRDDLGGALTTFDALPPVTKQALPDIRAALQTRQDVQTALQAVMQRLGDVKGEAKPATPATTPDEVQS